MNIRLAKPNDKSQVLCFCQNTFSWGDYISDVWDRWISEGNLLVAEDHKKPVGICHAFVIDENKVWIEGIRIDEKFRQKGYAKKLVRASEQIGKNNNCKYSFMLIAENNANSFRLAKSLGYHNESVWTFYTLIAKKTTKGKGSFATKDPKTIEFVLSKFPYFVKSWRWIPPTRDEIRNLMEQKNILLYQKNTKIESGAAIIQSEHFEKIALVTITFGNEYALQEIFSFLQNYFYERNFKRVQILTNLRTLPDFEGLERKISFHLMKKRI